MIEAGVQGLVPTIGTEVEKMKLEGYERFKEEIAEEWGVQTTGTGRASYTFDQPSGVYDIRITYFDAKEGQSRVKLLIAGTERASFKLDEDCDCWRWRWFKDIRVNKGDTVTLVGEAHRTDQARLDYIEFVRRAR